MPNEYPGVTIGLSPYGERESNTNAARTQDGQYHQLSDEHHQFAWEATGDNAIYNRVLGSFTLATETIEPGYGSDIEVDDGFLSSGHIVDAGTKTLRLDLFALTTYEAIGSDYQSKSFIYDAHGFYKMTFNFQAVLHSSYFILELIDDTGVVRWSKSGSSMGTDQVVNIISTSWKFRVRCIANVTTDLLFNNWITVSNIRMERYKSNGYVQQNWYHYFGNMDRLDSMEINQIQGVEGAGLGVRLMLTDDMETISPWLGPSSPADFYTGTGGKIYAGGYIGKYWRARVWLYSDGRYSPLFYSIEYSMYLNTGAKPISPIASQDPATLVPTGYTQITWHTADQIEWMNMVRNKRDHTGLFIRYASSWDEATVGIVMSGYARDQRGEVILGGYKLVLESSTSPDRDIMGHSDPESGVFQVFVKDAIYDRRWLLVEYEGKAANISLAGHGTPKVLDGTKGPVSNQDLHFWKAPICTTVAHVDSLVTY